MTSSIMPEWIKKIKAERDLKAAQAEAGDLRLALATTKIQSEGAEYWKELKKNLQCAADALPEIGFSGTLCDLNPETKPESEESIRVSVQKTGLLPMRRYVNLFYAPRGFVIRCHPQVGASYDLSFCLDDSKNVATIKKDHDFMNPEQASQVIIKLLLREVHAE